MAIKLVIIGAKGRMGTRIGELAAQGKIFEVVARLDVGSKPSEIGAGQVTIDFSQPEASLQYLREAAAQKKPYVVGTTGFTPEQDDAIKGLAGTIPIVKSSNMSLGVNVFFKVAEQVARTLSAYGIRVEEKHHVHKKDAPSGTALQAGKLMEAAGKQKVEYQSFREGEVVGDHRVIFKGPADRIELFHHAESRDIFASGALTAAEWVLKQKPGLYSMQDVLGLK